MTGAIDKRRQHKKAIYDHVLIAQQVLPIVCPHLWSTIFIGNPRVVGLVELFL